ncbi:hypothetical protein X474_13920 [Dethiosulfatarculus sandiegensis]|uniref:Uncharacterized protein n=1 Tax=Dethiosulfatarculus sandiegensis TaxID=1429043 RepID=A0A0D2JCB5_9BACT|nr:hypothetical protein X474_13920 [Dethiosulfatarculus sandiegensis]
MGKDINNILYSNSATGKTKKQISLFVTFILVWYLILNTGWIHGLIVLKKSL